MFTIAAQFKASDLHLTAGMPPVFRKNGRLIDINTLAKENAGTKELDELIQKNPEIQDKLMPEKTKAFIDELNLSTKHGQQLEERGSVDLAYSIPKVSRYRLNVYRQRGSLSLACRVLSDRVFSLEELFPYSEIALRSARNLSILSRGLVLVTGMTGSGKSTTLAAMIDYINNYMSKHIITLEDPVEYLHKHKNSMVNQREVPEDAISFASGLRDSLREDPDVILVGEMRDLETIETALTAAETGHLVLSTLHTSTASGTIERIIDVFPSSQQKQIRSQLSNIIQGIISQQLVPTVDELGRVCIPEILIATDGVRNKIREEKTHMIDSDIETGGGYDMNPMDKSFADMVKEGLVCEQIARERCVNKKLFEQYLS